MSKLGDADIGLHRNALQLSTIRPCVRPARPQLWRFKPAREEPAGTARAPGIEARRRFHRERTLLTEPTNGVNAPDAASLSQELKSSKLLEPEKKPMLSIRAEQMAVFEKAALRRFEDEMVAHSKDFSRTLCEVIGDDQLRVALRLAIARAMTYGFTNRGPIRLFIEMTFLCGSAFDTDPQYPMIGKILRASGDQMQRAEQIHEGHCDYLEKVSGPKAINVHNALRNLSLFAKMPVWLSTDDFVSGMLQDIQNVFPQKAAYVGAEALTALIQEGRAESRRYGFPTLRGEVLIVVLMFAFGHGCTNDPLYPWISNTLRDDRIVDPAARAARLEKKALTWLDQVNARNEKRAAT